MRPSKGQSNNSIVVDVLLNADAITTVPTRSCTVYTRAPVDGNANGDVNPGSPDGKSHCTRFADKYVPLLVNTVDVGVTKNAQLNVESPVGVGKLTPLIVNRVLVGFVWKCCGAIFVRAGHAEPTVACPVHDADVSTHVPDRGHQPQENVLAAHELQSVITEQS